MGAVRQRFERLIIPAALSHEIEEAFAQAGNQPTEGTIGRGPGGYFHHKYLPEELEVWRAFAQGVGDAAAQAEVVAAAGALSLARQQRQELEESLGEGALECLLAAQEGAARPGAQAQSEAPMLWSDDAGLREIGHGFGVRGASTFRLLGELWRSEVLTRDQFFDHWRRLILLGHRFLPVAPDFLAWTLERESFHATAEARAVFASLEPPATEESAIEAAAETLKLVWYQKPLHPRDLEVLDLCLDVLTKGRDTWRVSEQFKQALASPRRFGLLPLERERIDRAIRGWARVHAQVVERRLVLPPSASHSLRPASTWANGSASQDNGAGALGAVRVHTNGGGSQISGDATVLSDEVETEHHSLIEATRRVAEGVVCLLSALQFHVLTTQSPFEVWLAVPEGTSEPPEAYPPLRLTPYPPEALFEGVEEHSIEGADGACHQPGAHGD